jgi:hypothetical protein
MRQSPSADQAMPKAADTGVTGPEDDETGSVTFDLNRLTIADKVAGIASFVLLISLFLPWFGVTESEVTVGLSGTGAHGFLWLVLVLAVVVLTYLIVHAAQGWDRMGVNVPSREPVLLTVTGVQLVLVVIAFFDVPSTDIKGVSIGWQAGAYVALIAAIAAAATVIAPFIHGRVTSR